MDNLVTHTMTNQRRKADQMRGKRAIVVAYAIAFWCTVSSGVATAAVAHGVVAGMSLKWYGSAGSGINADAIYVNAGNGYNNGGAFSYAPTGSLAVPADPNLVGGAALPTGALQAKTVYYLYAICSPTAKILISVVAPGTDGRPTSAIADQGKCGVGVPAANDQNAVFIGSIMTDPGAAHLVPFSREGDTVLLHPSIPTGGYPAPPSSWVQQYAVPGPGGGTTCSGASAPRIFTEFPETASAMVVDLVTFENFGGNEFGILHPFLASTCSSTPPVSTTWNAQWIPHVTPAGPFFAKDRVTIKTSQNCSGTTTCSAGVYVVQPSAGRPGDAVTVTYVGYVEKIQGLNFF